MAPCLIRVPNEMRAQDSKGEERRGIKNVEGTRRREVERKNTENSKRPMVSCVASRFRAWREHEVGMLSQFPSGWTFVGVRSKATATEIVRTRTQSNIYW